MPRKSFYTHALVGDRIMSMEFLSLSVSNSECGQNQAKNILRGKKIPKSKNVLTVDRG